MQKGINNTKQSVFNLSLIRAAVKHFFLVLFAFTFFLQQLHAFSFLSNAFNSKKTSSGLIKSTHEIGTHFSLLPAHESELTAMEMEVDEDDYKHGSEQEFYSNASQKYAAEELVYNCILRSRYLQLASSFDQQPAVPFFILHHSWKNYIA